MLGSCAQSVVLRLMCLQYLVAFSVFRQRQLPFVIANDMKVSFPQVLQADGVRQIIVFCLQVCRGQYCPIEGISSLLYASLLDFCERQIHFCCARFQENHALRWASLRRCRSMAWPDSSRNINSAISVLASVGIGWCCASHRGDGAGGGGGVYSTASDTTTRFARGFAGCLFLEPAGRPGFRFGSGSSAGFSLNVSSGSGGIAAGTLCASSAFSAGLLSEAASSTILAGGSLISGAINGVSSAI